MVALQGRTMRREKRLPMRSNGGKGRESHEVRALSQSKGFALHNGQALRLLRARRGEVTGGEEGEAAEEMFGLGFLFISGEIQEPLDL
jgi:hypothetical protein